MPFRPCACLALLLAALVANGSAYAQAYGIAPGIALSAAQMAALTQDIVWLETREIDTPQGKQQALVPVVYVAALKSHDLNNQGGISGNTVVLNAAEALVNQGAIEGEQIAASAGSFNNSGSLTATQGASIVTTGGDLISSGTITGGAGPVLLASARDIQIESARETLNATLDAWNGRVSSFDSQQVERIATVTGSDIRIAAAGDLRIAGAEVSAAGSLALQGNNITLDSVAESAASSSRNTNGNNTGSHLAVISQLGSELQAGSDLTVRAANNLRISGSLIGAQGAATLAAGGNLDVQAALNAASYQFTGRTSSSSLNTAKSDETLSGSQIRAGNNLTLGAGIDLKVTASTLKTGNDDGSGGGNLSLAAGRDLTLTTGIEHDTLSEQRSSTSRGFFSKKTTSSSDFVDSRTAVGSTLSAGGQLDLSAGRNIALSGTTAVAQGDVTVAAQAQLILDAATSTRDEAHARQETKSGLFSGGGLSITLGNSSQKQTGASASVYNSGTTVGSLGGDVTLSAGAGYRQLGSAVLAPLGNITIVAPTVEIGAVRDTASSQQTFEAKQSGLTLSVSNPVVDAARSLQSLTQSAGQTSDPRMLALAAASAGVTVYRAGQAVAANPDKAGGISIGISLGSSKSQSESAQSTSTVAGSTVSAGRDLTIAATGNGSADSGDLTVTGSTLTAGNNASLAAAGNLTLQAAENRATLNSTNSSSSASVGVSLNYGTAQNGLAFTASASQGRGNANGNDQTWSDTQVSAGNTLALASGADTTLKGAIASGNRVTADVGGNLNIESLQDDHTYDSKQNSSGFNVSLCVPPLCYGAVVTGSIDAAKAKVNNDSLSAVDQAGIQAGTGGFDINVAGNTDLKGGVIASQADASLNRLVTATLTTSDLQNHSKVDGSAWGVGLGFSAGYNAAPGETAPAGAGAFNPNLTGAGYDQKNASASGATLAAISPGSVVITDEAGQQSLTGKTTAETIASLNRDTANANKPVQPVSIADGQKLMGELQANVQITQAFGREAAKAIGDYASGKLDEASIKQTAGLIQQQQADKARSEGRIDDANALQALAEDALQQADALRNQWGETGTSRIALHTLAGGLGGGVNGAAGAAASTLAAPEIARAIGELGLPDELNKVLVQGASATLGGAVGGAAGAAGALNEVANNYLTSAQQLAKDKELAGCKTLACSMGVKLKYDGKSLLQDAGLLAGVGGGAVYQGYGIGEAIVDMVANLPETMKGLTALVSDAEFRAKVGDAIANDYAKRIDTLNKAYNDGGMDGSLTAGVEAGRLAVDVIFAAQVAVGAAKIVATVAKAGAAVVAGDVARVAQGAAATSAKFTTEADQAFFWSGLGSKGASIASDVAAVRGGMTLEQFMQARGITLPAWDRTNPVSVQAWQEASRAYAANATGSVRAVLGDSINPESVWNTIELPTLKANPKVTQIIQVDPKTGVQTVIFRR